MLNISYFCFEKTERKLRKISHNAAEMKETLSTIASRLGVSVSTVSRVLSGDAERHRIPKSTAERILKEADRCNYTPSHSARSLRTSKSYAIGLVIPSMSNPFFADMASVIIEGANSRGYTAIIVDTMEAESNQKKAVDSLVSRQVEGIIVAPCGGEEHLTALSDAGLPVVLIDRYFEHSSLPYVTTNNYKGGVIATQTLLDYGHKDIACIQGVTSSMPNMMRVQGYLDKMKEAGLEDRITVVGSEFSIQNGYLEARLLLCGDHCPTAIFALSNTIGLGVMKAIREMNLRIPEDISLISFDNNIYLDYMIPPIARVSQPLEDMSRLATKILFERIADITIPSSHVMLSPSLIPGGSVRSLK